MADLVYPDLKELKRSHQPLTPGEWQVLDVLRNNLGGGWEIYVQPHLNGLKPDFVVLNPQIGVAIYEVKDWDTKSTQYRPRKLRKGKNEKTILEATPRRGPRFTLSDAQNPFTKIRAYRWRLHELYMPSLGIKGGETLKNITAGVIFTNSTRDHVLALARGFRQSGERPENFPIAGSDTLAKGDIRTILPNIDGGGWGGDGQDACRDLRGWLREPFLSMVQNTPLELNAKQRELSEMPPPSRTRRRRVRGPAGSGKSLVVCDRAVRLAGQGKEVLVTGFNITLLHYLRDVAARAAIRQNLPRTIVNRITFLHYHGWNSGLGRDEASYDAILIDEGNDITPEWHQNLREHLAEDGEMLLVVDRSQDVYRHAKAWTDDVMRGAGYVGPWTTLETSYRCPDNLYPRLHDFVKYLEDMGVDFPSNLPTNAMQGSFGEAKLRWTNVDPDDNLTELTEVCVAEVLNTMSDIEPDTGMADVIFLADNHELGYAVVRSLEELGITVRHTFSDADSNFERQKQSRPLKMAFWAGSPQVKASTIHSFKGWEARHLVVGISGNPLPDRDPQRMNELNKRATIIYTAMTRVLRHENGSSLTIVNADEIMAPYGESWKREPESNPVAAST